jgi:hypothetical protein
MSDKPHPFEGEDWVVEPTTAEYYQSRQRGNWFILVGILAFVAVVVALTMYKWDTQSFLDITNERQARQDALDAIADQQRRTQDAADANDVTATPPTQSVDEVEPTGE